MTGPVKPGTSPDPRRAGPSRLVCPHCGYDLSGTPQHLAGRLQCPECGVRSTPEQATPPPNDPASVAARTARSGLHLTAGCALAVFVVCMFAIGFAFVAGAVWTLVTGVGGSGP